MSPRPRVVVIDNYAYNHGHKGFDVSGNWVTIARNHNQRQMLREGQDPEGIGGWELTQTMVKQADSLGCQLLDSIEVSNVRKSDKHKFEIECSDVNRFRSQSLIITTGGQPRLLGLADEARFAQRGIHTCAQCAGARYRDKVVVIAGNGRLAVEAAYHREPG